MMGGHHIRIHIRDFIEESNSTELPVEQKGKDEYPELEFGIELLIMNNGEAMREDFYSSKFFERGQSTTGLKSKGLGGNHIKKGVESIGGKVELIEPNDDEEFTFKISLKFPMKITKSPTTFTVDSFIKSLS